MRLRLPFIRVEGFNTNNPPAGSRGSFRAKLLAVFLFCAFSLLPAGDDPEQGEAADVPFIIAPILEIISDGNVSWRPDWPREIPPDAFTLNHGRASLIKINAGGVEYGIRRNGEGRLTEFPHPYGGLAGVKVEYGPEGEIAGIDVAPAEPGQNPWTVFFPRNFFAPGAESLIRAGRDGVDLFAVVQETGAGACETWYDAEGRALAYAATSVRDYGGRRVRSVEIRDASGTRGETCHFESGGRVSLVEAGSVRASAVYGGRPLYWGFTGGSDGETEGAGNFSLQWDENGFLVRMYGPGGDFRYSYDIDEKGNWIRRRETAWEEAFGLLVPVSQTEIIREILYSGEN
jgi:hypothetical protein